MSNITINTKKSTIEMNKTYAKLASQYGTDEYKALQEVRRDYPNYRIVTVPHKVEKVEFKGLNYEFMEKYIKAHDDENGTKMEAYLGLRGKSEEAKELGMEAVGYAEIKEWFLMTYPALRDFINARENILEAVAKNKALVKQAKEAAKQAKKLAA